MLSNCCRNRTERRRAHSNLAIAASRFIPYASSRRRHMQRRRRAECPQTPRARRGHAVLPLQNGRGSSAARPRLDHRWTTARSAPASAAWSTAAETDRFFGPPSLPTPGPGGRPGRTAGVAHPKEAPGTCAPPSPPAGSGLGASGWLGEVRLRADEERGTDETDRMSEDEGSPRIRPEPVSHNARNSTKISAGTI